MNLGGKLQTGVSIDKRIAHIFVEDGVILNFWKSSPR